MFHYVQLKFHFKNSTLNQNPSCKIYLPAWICKFKVPHPTFVQKQIQNYSVMMCLHSRRAVCILQNKLHIPEIVKPFQTGFHISISVNKQIYLLHIEKFPTQTIPEKNRANNKVTYISDLTM
jgi:hypothetical protein